MWFQLPTSPASILKHPPGNGTLFFLRNTKFPDLLRIAHNTVRAGASLRHAVKDAKGA